MNSGRCSRRRFLYEVLVAQGLPTDTANVRREHIGAIDFQQNMVVVLGKYRRPRALPFGRKTALALDRYLRIRRAHVDAHHEALWLGIRGRLTPSGVYQVAKTRAAEAGIPGLKTTSPGIPSHMHGWRLAGMRVI
ncbi:MAG: hypothetical protein AB7T37_01780 [Dehalococcoidia bacterium]